MSAKVSAKRKQVLIGLLAVLAIAFSVWRLGRGTAGSGSDESESGAGLGAAELGQFIPSGPSQLREAPEPEDVRRRANEHVESAVAEAANAPWPALPDAPLADELEKQRAQWRSRMMVEAYNTHGTHSADWDEAAREFLRTAVRRTELGGADADVNARMAQLAAELAAAGCDDPWITYNRVYVVQAEEGMAGAEAVLRKAVEGLEDSTYPHLFRFYALRRLAWALREQWGYNHAEATTLWRRALQEFGLAAGDAVVRDGGLRSYAMDLGSVLSSMDSPEDLDRVISGIDMAEDPDPWASAVVRQRAGMVRISSRAAGNGGGEAAAPTVQEQLSVLYEQSAAAYKLHPEHPELAAGLIQICTGLSRAAEARDWFYKAVSAEYDNSNAYDSMMMSCLPASGGSHARLLAFGTACAAGGRFDTAVPHRYLDALRFFSLDLGGEWRACWRPESIQETVSSVCARYSRNAEHRGGWSALRYRSVAAVALWAGGRYSDAWDAMNDLGDGFDHMAFPLCFPNAPLWSFRGDLAVEPGALGDEWEAVYGAFARGEDLASLPAVPQGQPENPAVAAAIVERWRIMCSLPMSSSAEAAADTVRLLARLDERELLMSVFRKHRDALLKSTPDVERLVQRRVGPVAFALIDTMPPAGGLGLEAVEAGLEAVDSTALEIARQDAIAPESEAAAELAMHTALARLRWLLGAALQPESVQQYVTTVIAPQLAQVRQPGVLFDFVQARMRAGGVNRVLVPALGQFCLDLMSRDASMEYRDFAKRLSEFSDLERTDLPEACRHAFWTQGSLRLALAQVSLMREKGALLEAAVLKQKVDRWLWTLYQVTREFTAAGGWSAMATYNLVRNYEDEVIFYACHVSRLQPLQSAYLVMADAYARAGQWDRSAEALLLAPSMPKDQTAYYTSDGVFPDPDSYIKSTLEQIAGAESLEPDLRDGLRRTYPQIYGTVQLRQP